MLPQYIKNSLNSCGCLADYCRVMKGAAHWHTADFLSFTKGCFEDYDCILMSFAMHHLKADAKAEILKECHRLLKNRCAVA